MRDIHLALHSVLSELSSARDYLAKALAMKLNAPENKDSWTRLKNWLLAESRSNLTTAPVISDMLTASDKTSSDPWLYELGEYRNQFTHKNPIGGTGGTKFLKYDEQELGDLRFPLIEMPLGDKDLFAPGQDALKRFIILHRCMRRLLRFAAKNAPYESIPPNIISR